MKQQHSVALHQTQLAQLYQHCAPKMLTYVSRQVSSSQDAEDILTEVFVAALESTTFATLDHQQQQAWLWRVVHHKIIDTYRKAKGGKPFPLENIDESLLKDHHLSPEQMSIQQEEHNKLAVLLKRLPPLQQQVLSLRFGENLRCAQIAVQIGKRESSVRSLLSRAFNSLRRLYDTQEEGDHGGTR